MAFWKNKKITFWNNESFEKSIAEEQVGQNPYQALQTKRKWETKRAALTDDDVAKYKKGMDAFKQSDLLCEITADGRHITDCNAKLGLMFGACCFRAEVTNNPTRVDNSK